MQLRYVGFDQTTNIRKYEFDGVAGETAKHFVVSADLALFVRYHVGLQEGPALCLKRLAADLEILQPLPHELTGGDLAAYASAELLLQSEKLAGSGGLTRETNIPGDMSIAHIPRPPESDGLCTGELV